jgi:hypothetical protein
VGNKIASLFEWHALMTISYSSPSYRKRGFLPFLIVGTLTATGVLAGVAPNLSGGSPHLLISSSAYAQGTSNDEVTNYARIVWAIEQLRQSVYKEIQKIAPSSNLSNVACTQPKSLQSLPREAQAITANYCNQSKKIIETNGMTISRFNEMTQNQQSNPDLQRRIQNALILIQRL